MLLHFPSKDYLDLTSEERTLVWNIYNENSPAKHFISKDSRISSPFMMTNEDYKILYRIALVVKSWR